MVKKCVRIYVEGGATGAVADGDFRRGWKKFLTELHDLARSNGYHSLEIVRGKGRSTTFKSFKNHRNAQPDDLCILLVDSEILVPEGMKVWDVVRNREQDSWERPDWATERHLYLMVHFVETWLLTDQDALQIFFKKNFNPAPLPTTQLETRSKDDVNEALRKATNGKYTHGLAHTIIEQVQPQRVKNLRHGKRLFECLGTLIKNEPEIQDGKPCGSF